MSTLVIAPLQPGDLSDWLPLAQAYKAFYRTETSEAEYRQAWERLLAGDGVHGLGARVQGHLVGITHYLFHTSTWAPRVCYLQDLYVSEAHRGQGTAAALIEAVAQAAREGVLSGCTSSPRRTTCGRAACMTAWPSTGASSATTTRCLAEARGRRAPD